MNLALVIALAVLILLAFSIGLNLGLHGVLSIGNNKMLVRHNIDIIPTKPIFTIQELDINNLSQEKSQIYAEDNKLKSDNGLSSKEKLRSTESINSTVNSNKTITSIDTKKAVVETYSKSSLSVLKEIYDGKNIRDAVASAYAKIAKDGAITTYLAKDGKIPIVLLTCNRPEQLKDTLASILAVRGVTKDNLIIAQDGSMKEVSDIVKKHGLHLIQNTEGLNLRGGAGGDGATRIAKHYKYSLSAAFKYMPLSPAIIIAEDDLLFSPDFYEYLTATAPILENDPSTFVVSAWNDNGFKGLVKDPHALKRSDFFPGLGWLLPRELYEKELEHRWPTQHWDHWLRSIEVHGTRDIIYPEVPRTFHNGIQGTFMNQETHDRYFKNIDYNTNSDVSWKVVNNEGEIIVSEGTVPNYVTGIEAVYQARIEELISKCTHIKSFQELFTIEGVVCIWIDIDPTEPQGRIPEFQPISSFFGIWHEHRRGADRGLHEFRWEDKYILLFNVRNLNGEKNYKSLMPHSAVTVRPETFTSVGLVERKRKKMGIEGTPAQKPGMDCNEVCITKGSLCREDLLPLLNTCQALNEKFPCRDCTESFGTEQPAYVSPQAPQYPGMCMISTQPEKSLCSAKHKWTLRLCACA